MYEIFDDFLKVPTWYTRHTFDEQRFFRCLRRVVGQPGFNPDLLGEYMDDKRRDPCSPQAHLIQEAYDAARKHYVRAAWAVKGFLETPEE